MARQVRIRGRVKRLPTTQSDDYFSSRPLASQLSALASPQSRKIPNRESLEQAFNDLIAKTSQGTIIRPRYWGGYIIIPEEIEFWQGRDNRLHDRISYYKEGNVWTHCRLAP